MLEFVVQGDFFNCSATKRPTSQPEALFDEVFHGKAGVVGSTVFFLGTEQGEDQLNNHPVY